MLQGPYQAICIWRKASEADFAQHFILTIELVDGIPMLVLTYAREFVKGYWRMKKWEPPVHAFYEVYKEEMPLFFNFILFMLPLFSADRAFRHYKSGTEILDELDSIKVSDLESQSNHIISRIHFRNNLSDTPVFRPFSELDCGNSTGRARGADAFGKEFAALGYRSGYERNVTARACRRWSLMEAGMNHTNPGLPSESLIFLR
jgi:carbonic anhydrase